MTSDDWIGTEAARYRAGRRPPSALNGHSDAASPGLPSTKASTFAGLPKPEREFLDLATIFPAKNVTLLSGDGGVGKSLLALQLAVAVASNSRWLDIEVRPGAVVYFNAEDDLQEIHARIFDICDADGIDIGPLTNLHVTSLAGEDAVLATEDGKKGRMIPTEIYRQLEAKLDDVQPALLVIDNLADTFSGNENSRPLAKQFISHLRHLAMKYDCVVVLLGHPSLSGLSSGSGLSGSTAWNNSVRARLYLQTVKNSGDQVADDTIRELVVMKSNYSAKGQPIGLQWRNGRFIRKETPKPFDNVTLAHLEATREQFRERSYRTNDQSEDWGGFIVANIIGLDVGRGLKAGERTADQNQARTNVKTILNTWVRNKQICIVEGQDKKRERRSFYAVPDPE